MGEMSLALQMHIINIIVRNYNVCMSVLALISNRFIAVKKRIINKKQINNMAALQTIRSKGVLLVSVIALALFLFVAGDLFRGCQSILQDTTASEVNGEEMDPNDLQKMNNEFDTFMKLAQQQDGSFDENQQIQIRENAWQTYLTYKLVEKECNALGLMVTDEEVVETFKTGYSQYLQINAFRNPQTGGYDYSIINNFEQQYKQLEESGQPVPEQALEFKACLDFIKKQVKRELLIRKYQTLAASCITSNPVEAKMAFDSRVNESDIVMAAIPASTVADDAVKVSDDEINKKYAEDKELYKVGLPTRDLKIISVQVVASAEDKKALEDEMNTIVANLDSAKTNTQVANAIRQSNSVLSYANILKTKEAFPQIFQSELDSAVVGKTTKPVFNPMANAYYAYKVVEKSTQVDSVLYRQVGVTGKDAADIAKRADSIMSQLAAGSKFQDIAKKFNQSSDSSWVASSQFQNSELSADYLKYFKTIYSTSAGQTAKFVAGDGSTIIIQVLETRNPVTKYNVAAVIRQLQFSDKTYDAEFNKLSSFYANNKTLKDIEANAPKNGYTVRPVEGMTPDAYLVAGIPHSHDALKWAFDNANVGDVAKEIYKCGSDNLLLVALTGADEDGYLKVTDSRVKEQIESQLKAEKKVAKIYEDVKGIKSIAEAKKAKGAVTDTINHVTFANPTFVGATVSSEPLIGAVAAKTAKGSFATVKGSNGVYMMQVIKKTTTAEKYDEKSEKQSLAQKNSMMVSNMQYLIGALKDKAKIVDKRYKYM